MYTMEGGPKRRYKVFWKIKVKHTEDGYFYKAIELHKGHKYLNDYWDAKEELDKVNKSMILLGLEGLAETGIEEE
jgi:hypothetical protein